MSEDKSKFTKKVSPLIEGQVPDFVQADHPVFVDFVKDYFQLLKSSKAYSFIVKEKSIIASNKFIKFI